jgi:hypothetical protein
VGLEVLYTFLKELQLECVNLSMREWLHAVLLVVNDSGYGVDGLRRQLEHLLRGIGTLFSLALQILLSNTPSRLASQGLDCRIVNALLLMVI